MKCHLYKSIQINPISNTEIPHRAISVYKCSLMMDLQPVIEQYPSFGFSKCKVNYENTLQTHYEPTNISLLKCHLKSPDLKQGTVAH